MATIRQWLQNEGFDFENGRILFQDVTEDAYCPGWARDDYELKDTIEIKDHPILDHEFNDGYGSAQCPRFLAKDSKKIYFPSQYDGATCVNSIEIDLDSFVGNKKPLPYPGR